MISAQDWAKSLHHGQLYDGRPYDEAHLAEVVSTLRDLGQDDDAMMAAGWLHDSVEDVYDDYADKMRLLDEIRDRHGDETASLVWAVTGIGKTRKERNLHAYAKMVTTPRAPVLKFADRLINVRSSKPESRYWSMYRSEHPVLWQVIGPFVPAGWEAMMMAAFQ